MARTHLDCRCVRGFRGRLPRRGAVVVPLCFDGQGYIIDWEALKFASDRPAIGPHTKESDMGKAGPYSTQNLAQKALLKAQQD